MERGEARQAWPAVGPGPVGDTSRQSAWLKGIRRRTALTLAILLTLLVSAIGAAGEPPSDPILRIETGMHTAMIRRMVVDEPSDRMFTGADDKTVRVWRLRDGRLLHTLRFPIGEGHEGRVFGLALSPDGKTLAVSGWMGVQWDRKGAIYLFDTESGQLTRRITGLTSVVSYLAFSPDGRRLAAGLSNRQGLRVYRVSDWALTADDRVYNERIAGIDFAPDGTLAVGCMDGFVRLYDRDLRLIRRAQAQPGKQPVSVRFSPDGRTLAVGFIDTPRVGLLSASNLDLVHVPDPSDLGAQVNLTGVVWSHDGETLYAYGDFAGEGRDPIHRWVDKGFGRHTAIPVATERVTNMRPLRAGGMVYVTEDPSIGVIEAPAQIGLHRKADILNFRPKSARLSDQLAISHNADVLQFKGLNKPLSHFQLTERLLNQGAAKGVVLHRAQSESDQVRITDWKDSYTLKVNGTDIELDKFELSRCVAIAPDGRHFALGTDWALRFFDGSGKLLWRRDMPPIVWQVTVSGDGQWVVAALSDGTIRWYRREDGEEVLALFVHRNMTDWIVWNPDGYYMSSPYGDNYIGWHLNRGRAKVADFYHAVQFERILYRPDIVLRQFESRGHRRERAKVKDIGLFDISDIDRITPPRIRISELGIESTQDGPKGVLHYQAEKQGGEMENLALFVNNIPITPSHKRPLQGEERQRFARKLHFDLPSTENQVRIEVRTPNSIGVAERFLFTEKAPPPMQPGDLYLLAVGVSRFPGLPKEHQLRFAARDARELASFFRTEGAKGFNQVHIRVLADSESTLPTAANIREALDFLWQATGKDTVVLFLASHGHSNDDGDFYFLPQDTAVEELRRLLKGKPGEFRSIVGWRTFIDALREAAGRRLLIVDTCNAQGIAGKFDHYSLAKRSAASRFSLLVASKSGEVSREYPQASHGLFTYGLMRGLAGGADRDGDRLVTLNELFGYVGPFVMERLRQIDDGRGPQTPQLIAPKSLGRTILSKLTL